MEWGGRERQNRMTSRPELTYRDAGVDIESADAPLGRVKQTDADGLVCRSCVRCLQTKVVPPIRTGDEDQEGDENGSFCWNSRLWLALRGFLKPTGCPNQTKYENACRGCGSFEIR